MLGIIGLFIFLHAHEQSKGCNQKDSYFLPIKKYRHKSSNVGRSTTFIYFSLVLDVYLNSMIILVGDDYSSSAVDSDPGRSVELSRCRSVGSESPDEAAVLPVYLNAIVRPVGDDDVSLLVAGDAPRSAEVVAGLSVVADYLHRLRRRGERAPSGSDSHREIVRRHGPSSRHRTQRNNLGSLDRRLRRASSASHRSTVPDRSWIVHHY